MKDLKDKDDQYIGIGIPDGYLENPTMESGLDIGLLVMDLKDDA